MFGRMSYVHGDPARIDDLITYVRTVVKPATDELAGNHGLGMWVNRDTGDALVLTAWDDEATLRASEDAVLKLRDDAAGIVGGEATVARQEVLFGDAAEPHQVGNFMREVRMHCDPADIDANAAWNRETLIPQIKAMPGYLSYVLSTDRGTGAITGSSTYRDQAAADAAFAATAPIREAASQRGITFDDINQYEVAIVGIRASASMLPKQRMVDVRDQQDATSGH